MKPLHRVRQDSFYYVIFTPALVVILFLTVYPVLTVLTNSLFKYNFLFAERQWIGTQNFARIIRESIFQRAFLNTVIFSLSATAAESTLGLILALLFYGRFAGKRATMTAVIFPMMLSTMVICAIWKTMYHHDIGVLNYLLERIGLGPVGWLTDKRMALVSIMIVDVWQWTPFAFILLQAGLNSVPAELFEAAAIDGAGYLKTLFHITIPILLSQILMVFLLRTIDTFRIFDKVYALTQGGPGNATETVSYFVYREGFSFFNIGRASAASVYVLLVISIIAAGYIRQILRRGVGMSATLGRKGPLFWVLLLIIVVAVLAPIYWIVATALKTPTENILPEPTLFPQKFTLGNFRAVISAGIFGNFFNSLFVAAIATTLSLTLAFLASYALARHRFPLGLNNIFLIWVLAVKILPPIVLAIPLYTLFTRIGLLNTLWGLVIVYQVYTLPYCLWIIFGFVKALPIEFEQAATIDGASPSRILVSIVLPLTSGGIIATSIFSIIMAWNEFLFALLLIRTPSRLTLPLKIVSFIGEYETLWGELMAIGLLASLPILLFSGYVYKKLTHGFSMGLR